MKDVVTKLSSAARQRDSKIFRIEFEKITVFLQACVCRSSDSSKTFIDLQQNCAQQTVFGTVKHVNHCTVAVAEANSSGHIESLCRRTVTCLVERVSSDLLTLLNDTVQTIVTSLCREMQVMQLDY
jgi:hypothetical protein